MSPQAEAMNLTGPAWVWVRDPRRLAACEEGRLRIAMVIADFKKACADGVGTTFDTVNHTVQDGVGDTADLEPDNVQMDVVTAEIERNNGAKHLGAAAETPGMNLGGPEHVLLGLITRAQVIGGIAALRAEATRLGDTPQGWALEEKATAVERELERLEAGEAM